MKNKDYWVTVSVINLCIVAFLGFVLRTKFLFPLPFIDYKNLLSAHSHFAFGGWVTLILMVLLIEQFLPALQKDKKGYQFILWGIQVCSMGMVFSFPFQGYGFFSILFSTGFIVCTYVFSWLFLKDIHRIPVARSARLLVTCCLISLVLSSAGPFSLAYMMASNTGSVTSLRDAIYVFLHFQYNGFFTLAVFALIFRSQAEKWTTITKKRAWHFSLALCLSVIPSLFLSLLWHFYNPVIKLMSFAGCGFLLLCLFFFARLLLGKQKAIVVKDRLAKGLLWLSLFSFICKMALQTGTIVPGLGNAVFGYRPIIIGFLHLVFLGLVSFYIFSHLVVNQMIAVDRRSRFSLLYFSAAIIINEIILLIDGIGLLFKVTHPVFGWLLWIASILLFTGALLIVLTRPRFASLSESVC